MILRRIDVYALTTDLLELVSLGSEYRPPPLKTVCIKWYVQYLLSAAMQIRRVPCITRNGFSAAAAMQIRRVLCITRNGFSAAAAMQISSRLSQWEPGWIFTVPPSLPLSSNGGSRQISQAKRGVGGEYAKRGSYWLPPPLPPGPPAVLGQPPGRTKLSLVLYLAPVKLLSYYVKCCFFATSIHSL